MSERALYEDLYCARGKMEIVADRLAVSRHFMRAGKLASPRPYCTHE